MSVTVDAYTSTPPRGPGRRRWPPILAAALAGVAVVATLYATINRTSAAERPPETGGSATVLAAVSDRIATVLERSSPEEHGAHGHSLDGDGGSLLCAVEVFGVVPTNASRLGDVGRAYGYHLCAVVAEGRDWDFAPKLVGPIAVDFGDPPVIRVVEGGEGYQDRVRQLIPTVYQRQARSGFTDPKRVADLRRRYAAAAMPKN